MCVYAGGCHCRNITVAYQTDVRPEDAKPRACQCSFCRKHQSRAVSDPAGSLRITVADGAALSRYQFGFSAADFLICRTCGVYVAAFMPDPDDATGYATLMVSALDDHALFPPPQPTSYSDEDGAGRRARRRRVWTPATLGFA